MVDFTKMRLRQNVTDAILKASPAADRPDSRFNLTEAYEVVRQAWLAYDDHLTKIVKGASLMERRLKALRWFMGYIECGEGRAVSLSQDDVTKTFSASAGKTLVWDESFYGLLDKLAEQMDTDPERS